MLLDRLPERAALSQLLDSARARRSSVLVMHGEPGVGKTALLEYAIESAAGLRIARVAGVEPEMELAFAALQQLYAPMLDRLEGLPDPQRTALGVAFGLSKGRRRTVSGRAGRAQLAVGGGRAAAPVVRGR
jgi:AAA ATPase domain